MISYSILINACAAQNDSVRAEQYVEEMEKEGLKGNVITFTSVISACARGDGDSVEKAEGYFKEMKERGVEVNEITYNALLHACASAGDGGQAVRYFEEMKKSGLKPCVVTYSTLIQVHFIVFFLSFTYLFIFSFHLFNKKTQLTSPSPLSPPPLPLGLLSRRKPRPRC